MEMEVKHKDGHKIPVEVNTRIVKKDGKIGGFVCIVRDITERKRAEEKLKRRTEEMEKFHRHRGRPVAARHPEIR